MIETIRERLTAIPDPGTAPVYGTMPLTEPGWALHSRAQDDIAALLAVAEAAKTWSWRNAAHDGEPGCSECGRAAESVRATLDALEALP